MRDRESDVIKRMMVQQAHTIFDIEPPSEEPEGRYYDLTATRKAVVGIDDDVHTQFAFRKTSNIVYFDVQQFVKAVKNKWNTTNSIKASEMMSCVKEEVTRLWDIKRRDVLHYPEEYNMLKHVPLTCKTGPGITFDRIKTFNSREYESRIQLPSAKDQFRGKITLPSGNLKDEVRFAPVSWDALALRMSRLKTVDIVISRSGLKTLIDCHSFAKSPHWILPFSVKEVMCAEDRKPKTVLFIDKALARPLMSTFEQKNWHGKLAVNAFLNARGAAVAETENKNKKLQETFIHDSEEKNDDNELSTGSTTLTVAKNSDSKQPSYSYELWNLSSLEDKITLLKNAKKDFNILVRNKKPALKGKGTDTYCVSSKLEYQQEYGGEQVSLSQLKREWVSMFLNPGSKLIRVRADANTLRYINHEEKDLRNIEENIFHLYGLQMRSQLNLVYNTLNELKTLPTGEYLLQNMDSDGMFATIFVASTDSNKNKNFNLHASIHSLIDDKKQIIPWPTIDLSLITKKIRFRKSDSNVRFVYKTNPNELPIMKLKKRIRKSRKKNT